MAGGFLNEVILSHSDDDHIGGLIQLLMAPDIAIGTVHAKTDTMKTSKRWESVRRAVRDARERTKLNVRNDVALGAQIGVGHKAAKLEVLSPAGEEVYGGPGAKDTKGRPMTSNTLSSVVRVSINGTPSVLFAGDIDATGLDHLLENQVKPNAAVLVFPHHGGRVGHGSSRDFAAKLCAAVGPEWVVFSHGRRKHLNPREEVIQGVRDSAPSARILCTQLSRTCAKAPRAKKAPQAEPFLAAGEQAGECCAGNISVSMVAGKVVVHPAVVDHDAVIAASAETPLCRHTWPVPAH